MVFDDIGFYLSLLLLYMDNKKSGIQVKTSQQSMEWMDKSTGQDLTKNRCFGVIGVPWIIGTALGYLTWTWGIPK